MTSDQITVTVWEPSPEQRWAISLIAKGYSQTEAARIIEVEDRTVRRWWATPEFRQAINDEQDQLLESFGEAFSRLIRSCMRTMQLVADGELDGASPRARAAHDTLRETVFPMVRLRPDGGRSLAEQPQLNPGPSTA